MDDTSSEWKKEAVLLLLSKYEANKSKLEKKNSIKKHVWKQYVHS